MFALLLQTAAQPDATDLMVIFFGCVVLTLVTALYIFLPTRVESSEAKTRLAYLYERKEVIYDNLRDLNFEQKAGKLSEGDFEGVRNSMEEEAAALLAEIEQLEQAGRTGTTRPATSRNSEVRA